MNRQDRINQEVEKTLNVFESLPNLEENPFLFTRIKVSLSSSPLNKKPVFFLRPIIIVLLLIFNLITGLLFFSSSEASYPSDKQNLELLISDYNFNQTNNNFISSN